MSAPAEEVSAGRAGVATSCGPSQPPTASADCRALVRCRRLHTTAFTLMLMGARQLLLAQIAARHAWRMLLVTWSRSRCLSRMSRGCCASLDSSWKTVLTIFTGACADPALLCCRTPVPAGDDRGHNGLHQAVAARWPVFDGQRRLETFKTNSTTLMRRRRCNCRC